MKKNLLKQALTISSVVLLSLVENSGLAQTLFDKIRQVPVITPQAAASAKYVEFPVNLYNGIPSISFPLYTIQSGDISIPIDLSYHAGGIKVSEESSWVGLGFNLQVGGTITRQVVGKDDFREPSNDYFGIAFPGMGDPTRYNEDYTNLVNRNVCMASAKNGDAIQGTFPGEQLFHFAQNAEGEPDTYIYNFGPYAGKFINTGVAVANIYDINRTNIKFNIQAGLKITATTPEGFRYEFADLEQSFVGPYPTITGYYLSKITSPTGKEVTFQYEFLSNIHQMTTWSEEFLAVSPEEEPDGETRPSDIPLTPTKSYPLANPVYLAKITFDEGYVNFVRSTREDMHGKKLDQVEVHYKDGSLLKTFAFQQSYFVTPPTSVTHARHYLEPSLTPDPGYIYPEDFLRKRLRLDALIETGNGSDPNEIPKKHSFEYYNGSGYTLPYKSSWAVDYWGFYNGKELNVGFIPSTKGFNITSSRTSITDYKGSYREPDPYVIKAATLKKVTYPTKGWTEYEYSANQYTNTENTPIKFSYYPIASACDPVSDYLGTAGVQEKTFSFAGGSAVIKVNLFCDCGFNMVCMCLKEPYYPGANWTCGDRQTQGESNNILYAELRKFNPSTGNYDFMGFDFTWDFNDVVCHPSKHTAGDIEETVTLPAGKYKIIANYPDNKVGALGQTMAQIEVGHIVQYRDTVLYGGGLRVAKITHHDPEQNVNLTSTFDYKDGILMKFPVFYWQQLVYFGSVRTENPAKVFYDSYYYDYLYSNSIIPFSPSANGNVVGYSKVTEKRQGGGIGKTEYMYENKADNFNVSGSIGSSYAPGVPSTPHIKNGFLKETIVYDNGDVPVKRVTSEPQVAGAETFWAFKGLLCRDGDFGQDWPPKPCATPLGSSFMYYFYPIQLGKVVPAESTEYEYNNNNSGLTLATTTTYQYNALTNKKSEQKILSNGRVSLSEYKYLMDYDTTSGWLRDMNRRNISSSPLEVFQKMDGKVVAGTFLKYKTVGSKTLPFEVYNIETAIPKVISSTAPYAVLPDDLKLSGTVVYDVNGNMRYSQAKDNTVTSYLYGYPNSVGRPMHAIAIGQNAMPDQLYHTSFEDFTTGFTTDAKTGAKAYNGGAAFVVPLPAAGGTYKLTYWKKDGSGNGWQFVDDVMSADKAIGGSGTVIDEVRVSPVDAQMTTYTYDLLQGVTTVTDVNSNPVYFNYDSFSQLKLQRDKDYKIVKQYKYHYKEY